MELYTCSPLFQVSDHVASMPELSIDAVMEYCVLEHLVLVECVLGDIPVSMLHDVSDETRNKNVRINLVDMDSWSLSMDRLPNESKVHVNRHRHVSKQLGGERASVRDFIRALLTIDPSERPPSSSLRKRPRLPSCSMRYAYNRNTEACGMSAECLHTCMRSQSAMHCSSSFL